MFSNILVFFYLLYASFTDFRYRRISNYLTFSLMFFGILINLLYSIYFNDFNYLYYSLIYGFLTFFICYVLWNLGIFAGGDAKLLTGISFSIPFMYLFGYNVPTSLYLFLMSIILLFLYNFFFGLKLLFLSHSFDRKKLFLGLLNVFKSFALFSSIYIVLSLLNIPIYFAIFISILSIFFNNYFKYFFIIIFLPISLYFDPIKNLYFILSISFFSCIIWFLFRIYFLVKSGALNYTKKVSQLSVGDLLLYPLVFDDKYYFLKENFISKMFGYLRKRDFNNVILVYNRQKYLYKKIVVNNRLAMGLTMDDINIIKNNFDLDFDVELKITTPMVPAMFLSFILVGVFL